MGLLLNTALFIGAFYRFILKAAVEREKAVQAVDAHREFKNCVVTF